MRDLHNIIHPSRGLSPVVADTDNTPYVSQILDTKGFDSAEFLILTGVNTDADATFTVLVEDGADSGLGDHAAVDDKFLLGTEALASFTAANDDNKVFKIGYIGPKRYVRVTITPAANGAGNIYLAGVWLQGHPALAATANPPQ
jgi:hypothetical protein